MRKTLIPALITACLLLGLSPAAYSATDAGPDTSSEAATSDDAPEAATAAEGPTAPTNKEAAASMARQAYEAAHSKEWVLFVGLTMLLFVYVLRRWSDELSWFRTRAGGVVLGYGVPLLAEVGAVLAVYGSDISLRLLGMAVLYAIVDGTVGAGFWSNRPAKFQPKPG